MSVRVIGLTGGIASGKSTVARMLRDRGLPVLDADAVARDVVEPGQPAFDDIRRAFGDEVVGADGRLDRARLGDLVFRDAAARRRLEAITHPRIFAAARRRIEQLGACGEALAVWEAALLVETDTYRALDGLIVVRASEATQIERLRARDGLDEEKARARLAAQLPLDDKIALADYVIDNDGALAGTEREVEAVVADLRGGGPRRTGAPGGNAPR